MDAPIKVEKVRVSLGAYRVGNRLVLNRKNRKAAKAGVPYLNHQRWSGVRGYATCPPALLREKMGRISHPARGMHMSLYRYFLVPAKSFGYGAG